MLSRLIRWSFYHPLLVILATLLVVAAGVLALVRAP